MQYYFKKIIKIFLFLLLSGCTTSNYNQRLDAGMSGLMNVIVRNVASAAAGNSFDTQRVINEFFYVGSAEVQSQIYDNYYGNIREQHKKEALEREYQIWAEKEDRKYYNKKEEYFHRRYYGW